MTPNQVDVTVSIVNWNTKEELEECLRCVLAQESVNLEVNVVDNASSDGSADMVIEKFDGQLTLIRNSRNLGFGTAHNQSLKRSVGRYALLLNPDCRMPDTDVLAKLSAYLDDYHDIGIVGPKILNPDGTLQYSARHFPNMIAAVFRHTVFGRLFPKNKFVREYLMLDWSHDEATDVDWVSGAAIMIRRETMEQIGLLDERFFMYCEDVDWCRRAHEAGWRVVYFPKASVSHRIGAASDKNPVSMIKQHHRSMLKYFIKYEARSPKILLTPIVLVGLFLRAQSLIRKAKRTL